MDGKCCCIVNERKCRTVEGDWRVGDVSMVRVLLSRPNAVCMRKNFDVVG